MPKWAVLLIRRALIRSELYPVSGKKSAAAAQTAGLAPSSISTLLVEGDNRPGLGHAIAKAVGDAGINMSFVMAQVVGQRYSAVFGLSYCPMLWIGQS